MSNPAGIGWRPDVYGVWTCGDRHVHPTQSRNFVETTNQLRVLFVFLKTGLCIQINPVTSFRQPNNDVCRSYSSKPPRRAARGSWNCRQSSTEMIKNRLRLLIAQDSLVARAVRINRDNPFYTPEQFSIKSLYIIIQK